MKIIFYPLILFLSCSVIMISCNEQMPEEDTTPPVRVKTASVKSVTESFPIRSSGQLSSKTETKLSFKTGGLIQDIQAGEGESVKKGKLLARLDLSEVEAQVRQAELAFEKAKRDLHRVENLYADSVATLENLQDATTARDVAASNLKIARFNLQHSKIVAPSDGKILRKLASTNELIQPGNPVFLFAPSKEDMVVRVNLTDKEIVRVNMGDSARIYFDAYPGHPFQARITEIANAADPFSGTYEVELQLRKSEKKLISGFVARVVIFPQDTDDLVSIPVEALIDGLGRIGYVYAVEGNKPVRKKIQIARIEENRLLLTSGLKSGETVITEGAQYIRDNSVIEIVHNQ